MTNKDFIKYVKSQAKKFALGGNFVNYTKGDKLLSDTLLYENKNPQGNIQPIIPNDLPIAPPKIVDPSQVIAPPQEPEPEAEKTIVEDAMDKGLLAVPKGVKQDDFYNSFKKDVEDFKNPLEKPYITPKQSNFFSNAQQASSALNLTQQALFGISNIYADKQKQAQIRKMMADATFNPTFSYTQPVYGEDETRYLGYKKGGEVPSKSKAEEMLKDGTANGKKLTKNQEKLFRALSHGWKPKKKMEDGGEFDEYDFLFGDDEDQKQKQLIAQQEDILKREEALAQREAELAEEVEQSNTLNLVMNNLQNPDFSNYTGSTNIQGSGMNNIPQASSNLSSYGSVGDIMNAIGKVESGGNYQALGPVLKKGSYAGDRAYGRWQVMGKNIPSWSKEALGRVVSKEEFLANPQIQEAIVAHQMNKNLKKYGNIADVASIWLSGKPYGKSKAKDYFGTDQTKYVNKVMKAYGSN